MREVGKAILASVLTWGAIVLLAWFLSGCCQLLGVGCAVVQYPISGKVEVFNECDGLQASIPNQVTLELTLVRGNQEIGTTVQVALAPDPANPNAPYKIGTYNTNVAWAGANPPTAWKRVGIKANGLPVCNSIPCPDPTKTCMDFATATPTFPIGNPTVEDVRASCGCN